MNIHKEPVCNVIGHYCWTHKAQTEVGIPGWPMGHKGNYMHYSPWASNANGGYTEAVIWANGDVENKRTMSQCVMCGKHCKYPVGRAVNDKGDNYREISKC